MRPRIMSACVVTTCHSRVYYDISILHENEAERSTGNLSRKAGQSARLKKTLKPTAAGLRIHQQLLRHLRWQRDRLRRNIYSRVTVSDRPSLPLLIAVIPLAEVSLAAACLLLGLRLVQHRALGDFSFPQYFYRFPIRANIGLSSNRSTNYDGTYSTLGFRTRLSCRIFSSDIPSVCRRSLFGSPLRMR